MDIGLVRFMTNLIPTSNRIAAILLLNGLSFNSTVHAEMFTVSNSYKSTEAELNPIDVDRTVGIENLIQNSIV